MMQELKTKIKNAKSTQQLKNIVNSIPKQANGERCQIANILDDAFWYINITTFEMQQKFMLSRFN